MISILLKYVLIFVMLYAARCLLKSLLRRIFTIQKDLYSTNYVQQRFNEVDTKVKNYSIIVLLVALVMDVAYFEESYFFIITVFLYTFIRMAIKAYYERKYSKDPRQSILTFSDLFVLTIALIIILKYNLLYG